MVIPPPVPDAFGPQAGISIITSPNVYSAATDDEGGGGSGKQKKSSFLDSFRPRSKSDATRSTRKPNLFAHRRLVR